jgi:hypothetical protein
MTEWAIIENNTVVNRIVAETKEIAELVTGKMAIETTDEMPLYLNSFLENGIWYPPKPDDGQNYSWDNELKGWVLLA